MNLRFVPEQIETREIGSLIRNPRNARTHSPEQIAELAACMKGFGFMSVVLVDEHDKILAGQARVDAGFELGLTRVPVIVVAHLTESEKQAYAIADNQIAQHAGWNSELLRVQLEALKADGVDLAVIGFSEREFNDLVDELESELRRQDEDSAPEAAPETVTRLGDMWQMGDHLLLCGDALDPACFAQLLSGESASMVFSDSPYNVRYRAPEAPDGRIRHGQIANDDLGSDFPAFLEKACGNMLAHTNGALYLCMSSSELHTLYTAFTAAGGHWSTFLIWGKSTFALGRSDYHRQFEPILYGWREGVPHYWCGARDQGDLWLFDKPHANDLHPTMKPVALIEKAVLNSSRRGESVLDPFAGSGSTLIACEKTGRKARLIELEPRYCDVIVKRWQDFTGKQVIQASSGATFDALRAQPAKLADQQSKLPSVPIPEELAA